MLGIGAALTHKRSLAFVSVESERGVWTVCFAVGLAS